MTFTDSSTGTSITNRRWDFGDGNISNYAAATNPSHRYTSAGTYTVNLTVTNAGGSNSQLRSNYISVSASPSAPVAAFTGTPLSGTAPLTVTFTDSSTGSGISAWKWDFNNDKVIDSSSQNPTYTYTSAGTYTVNLTITGTGGSDSEVKMNYINVGDANLMTTIGIYRNGVWSLDSNGNGAWDAGIDKVYNFGTTGSTSVIGDWNGDRKTEIGVYKDGTWYLDYNGDGLFTSCNR